MHERGHLDTAFVIPKENSGTVVLKLVYIGISGGLIKIHVAPHPPHA